MAEYTGLCIGCSDKYLLIKRRGKWVLPEHPLPGRADGKWRSTGRICPGSLDDPRSGTLKEI